MFYTKLLRAGQVSYCYFTQPDQLRHISEAVTGGVLENFAIIKNCYKRDSTLAQVLSCEFRKILRTPILKYICERV